MSTLKFSRHGEHIKPCHSASKEGGANGAGLSTEAERPDGNFSGVVKRFRKREQASTSPISFGLIKTIHAHSVEYKGIPDGVRGLIMFFGFLTAGISIGMGQMILRGMIRWGIKYSFDYFIVFIISVSLIFLSFGLYMAFRSIRLELFRPVDEPIIFDRKHRKVYRIFRETQPGMKGLLMQWPMRAAEYEWDLIDVEHNATLSTTGSTAMRYHALVFIVRKSAADPTIIDSFNIGNSIQIGEQTVPAVWEHIRRFMEESGPHLPPGEELVSAASQSFLRTIIGGPFWPKYRTWWREADSFMLLGHVLFPILLPPFLLWIFFNWLSYETARPIEWPQEVLEAVGTNGKE